MPTKQSGRRAPGSSLLRGGNLVPPCEAIHRIHDSDNSGGLPPQQVSSPFRSVHLIRTIWCASGAPASPRFSAVFAG